MASPTPQKLQELLLDLIEKVEDPIVKAQYLSKFQKTLVRETKEPKPKSSKSLINFEEVLNRFTKVKKEVDDEEVEIIFDESANPRLQTKDKTARIHDQLFNLKCPTLSDFKWYKDVFIARVMLRDDCNSPFWKEKFINGLPSLFANKILLTLSSPLGVIDYDNLTYGDIFSVIRRECLNMYIDMKIIGNAKYDARSFCTEYDLRPIAPSKRESRRKPKRHS